MGSQHIAELLIYRDVLTKGSLIILLLKVGLRCQEVRHMVAAEEFYTIVLHRNSFASKGSVPVTVTERGKEELEVTLNFCFYEGRHNIYIYIYVCVCVCVRVCVCVCVRVCACVCVVLLSLCV